MQDGGAAEHRVQGDAAQEPLQRVGAAVREVRSEPVAPHVLHALLVGDRGHGARRVLAAEGLVKEDEVGEAAARGEGWFLEGGEGGLVFMSVSWSEKNEDCIVVAVLY